MRLRAVSFIEALLVIGFLALLAGFSIPLYRTYQMRSDLELSVEQIRQGLGRAQLMAQNANEDAGWGFYIPAGVIFRGSSYAGRDPSFDELYPMPSAIRISGSFFEVSYEKLSGKPSHTGSIILVGLNDEQRIINVTFSLRQQNITLATPPPGLGAPSPPIDICHMPGTAQEQDRTIPFSDWPAHEMHGDAIGACAFASPPSPSTAVQANGIQVIGPTKMDVTVRVLAATLTYGEGGDDVPVKIDSSKNGGGSWNNMFGGQPIIAGDLAAEPNVQPGSSFTLKLRGYLTAAGMLTYDTTRLLHEDTGQVIILRDGNQIPSFIPADARTDLQGILTGYLEIDGRTADLPPDAYVVLVEFDGLASPPPPTEDYTDAVLLLTFTP